ncbi:MAG: RDD family protein [Defluviitaleaceae bacterium]|nr:RDD family protein [Defluviitaleaceae bacterium]
MDNHNKITNFGALADRAFDNYRRTFAAQAALSAIIGTLFIITIIGLAYLGLAVIWPAIPNFTGNQPLTEGIFLGIFFFVMLLFIMFFLAWQSAANITTLRSPDIKPPGLFKKAAKSSFAAFTVILAQLALFLPLLALLGIILFLNLSNLFTLLPIFAVLIFLILISLRALALFATNIALAHGRHFLSPIITSAKIVIKMGFFKIFITTALISIFNTTLYAGFFLALAALFGIIPADIIEFALLLADSPHMLALALALAYIPTIFIAPKLAVLAHGLYTPADSLPKLAGLASRTLAMAIDFIAVAIIFGAIFFGAATLLFGADFTPAQMNAAAITATFVGFFAVLTIYNIYFEVFENGRTPGKALLGLVVLNQQGKPPTLVQSLVRNVLRIVDIFGFIAIIINKNHHRLGDTLSLTTVKHITPEETEDNNVSG